MQHINFNIPEGLTKEQEVEWKRKTVEALIIKNQLGEKEKPTRKKKDLTLKLRTVLKLDDKDWEKFKEQSSKRKLNREDYLTKVVKQALEVCYEGNRDQED